MKMLDYLPIPDGKGRVRDALLHIGPRFFLGVAAMATTRGTGGWTNVNVPLGRWGHLSFSIKKHPRRDQQKVKP